MRKLPLLLLVFVLATLTVDRAAALPTAYDDVFTTSYNTPYFVSTVSLVANDIGTGLELSVIGWPPLSDGSLSGITVIGFTFTPTLNFVGTTGGFYTIRDSAGNSDSARWDINVLASTVPDTGTTLTLLGLALTGLAYVRRRIA